MSLGGGAANALLLPRGPAPDGARAGPYSTVAAATWFGPAGSGFDMVDGTFYDIAWFRTGGTTNNQTLVAFNNGSTTGFRVILGNDRSCNFFNGASFLAFSTINYLGLQRMLIGQLAGTLWWSLNGSTGASFARPGGAYVPGGASAIQAFGGDKSSNNFAATQLSLLSVCVLTGKAFTPADMAAITRQKNALDRWHISPLVLAAGPQWVWNVEGWDGATTTFAGTGAGAITMTRGTTGPAKATLLGQMEYPLNPRALGGSDLNLYYENGAENHRAFSFPSFNIDSADVTNGPYGLSIVTYSKQLNVVGNGGVGVNVAGANTAGNNVGGEVTVFDQREVIDVPIGTTAGAKDVVLTESIYSVVIATGEIKPYASVQGIRVPRGTKVVWKDQFAAAPANVQTFVGDSLFEQQLGLTDVAGIKGPFYESTIALQRAAAAPRLTSAITLGGDTAFRNMHTAAARTFLVNAIMRTLRGTASNWVREMLQQNDQFFNTYVLLTDYQADQIAFWTQLKAAVVAAGIPGFKYQAIGTWDYTGGSSPNPSGWTVADFRTAKQAAIATFADPSFTYIDMATTVSLANKPDGKHANATGHGQASTFLTANPPP